MLITRWPASHCCTSHVVPAQPSAVQHILTATVHQRIKKPDPTHSRAVLSSQSQKRHVVGFYVSACERHPRHLSVTVVLSEWGSAGDVGLFDLIAEGEHTVCIPHHTHRGNKSCYFCDTAVPSENTHTHTHPCTSIVVRTFIGMTY